MIHLSKEIVAACRLLLSFHCLNSKSPWYDYNDYDNWEQSFQVNIKEAFEITHSFLALNGFHATTVIEIERHISSKV